MTRRGELLKKLGYDQVEKPAKTNIGWASARMTAQLKNSGQNCMVVSLS